MTAPDSDPASDSSSLAAVRGGPWPAEATYNRGPARQAAFERAVATLWAQDVWVNPRTRQRELNADLVLEGGGVKGIGLAGAICVLAEAGYRFPRAAGTSAGAVAAVLVAAVEKSGQNMTVLRDYLRAIDYKQFMTAAPSGDILRRLIGEISDLGELLFRGGLFSGGYLETWLTPRLADCGVATWADLALSADDDPGISLPADRQYRAVVHVSDITRGMLARLPWDYREYYGLTPADQLVTAAVRASMSIPFFFVPVRAATLAARTRLPDGREIPWRGGTVTWVDGGMLMNFPIDAWDRADGGEPRWPTIGIKLSAEPGAQPVDVPAGNALDEAYRCLKTMTAEWDRYHVDQATADRTIFVRNGGISATEFGLGPEQQGTLFRNGAEAATDFLIKWAATGHVPRSTGRPVRTAAEPALDVAGHRA
jgi:NTE family protein